MKYWLHYDLPFEPYFAVVGSLDEVKQFIRDNPHVSVDDLSLFISADVDIFELAGEVRGKDYYKM